MKLTFQFTAEN